MKRFARSNLIKFSGIVLVLILAFSHCYVTHTMDTLVGAASETISDTISKDLSVSLGDTITDTVAQGMKDAFKGLPDTLEGEAATDFSQAVDTASESLSESLEAAVKPLEDMPLAELTTEQVTEFTEKVTQAVDTFGSSLEEKLPEGATFNDTALTKSLTGLQDELTQEVSSIAKAAENTIPLSEEAATAVDKSAKTEEPPAADSEKSLPSEGQAKDLQNTANAVAKEAPTFWEQVQKEGFTEAFSKLVKENMLSFAWWSISTLAAGFVFIFPNWIMSSIQSKQTNDALKATQQVPQYFGGLWMRIPNQLIDEEDPSRTLYVYSRITNPDPTEFGQLATGGSLSGSLVDVGNVDNTNFFVTSGGGYGNCGTTAWGLGGINSTSFANQMIHLNTGLEFIGDGTPLNVQYPFRQLMPADGSTGDVLNNCSTTIGHYLQLLASQMSEGITTVSYNPAGAGSITTTGSPVATGSYAASMSAFAQKLFKDKHPVLLNKTFVTMRKQFTLGQPVQSDSKGNKLSGGFRLQAVSSGATDAVPSALGMFIYQTPDTPIALQARQALQSQGKSATAAKTYDYVFCLDNNNNYVPGLIPQIHIPAGGITSTKPATITWVPNPRVVNIVSVLSTQQQMSTIPVKAGIKPQQVYINLSGGQSIPPYTTLFGSGDGGTLLNNLVDDIKTSMSAVAQGPFTYGSYVLTIPAGVSGSGLNIYTIDSTHNKTTTLGGGGTDYIVPLDQNFAPLSLPGQPKYFVSLVTSTVYDHNMVPSSNEVKFNIVQSTDQSGNPQGSAFVLTTDAYNKTASTVKATCNACTNLKTKLGTLYQEYDVNPFNGSTLTILSKLNYQIAQALQNSQDSLYSGVDSTSMAWFAAGAANVVVGSLSTAGLSFELLREWAKSAGKNLDGVLTQIAQAIAPLITQVITQGLSQNLVPGPFSTMVSTKAANSLGTLVSAASNPAVATVFANLGSNTLKSVLSPKLQQVFNGLAQYLGQFPSIPLNLALAQSGLIPLGGLYVYTYWQLAPGGKGSLQTYLSNSSASAALSAINTGINSSHSNWKTWLISQSSQAWEVYQAMGPFSFTTTLVPNIMIEAYSLQDLQNGDFVYISPNYPNDYFIVASELPADYTISGSAGQYTQPFDPTNPQPYLISLVTGHVYQRTYNPKLRVESVGLMLDSSNRPVVITNVDTVKNSLKSADLKQLVGSAATAQSKSWPRYSYAQFSFTIDPQDVKNNTFIYQDITDISKFPPPLSSIKDFFVGGRQQAGTDSSGKSTTTTIFNIPMENNPDLIVSLVTGAIYTPKGYSSTYRLSGDQLSTNVLLNQIGGTIRPALRSAILALAAKEAAATTPKKPTKQPQELAPEQLTSSVVTALLSSSPSYLPAPFNHLKFYNNKYYGVMGAAGSSTKAPLKAIFDYNATTRTEGKSKIPVGFLYDSNGNPVRAFDGLTLNIARAKAGVIVNSDGSEALGVPNGHPPFNFKAGTLTSYDQSTPAIAPVTLSDGTQYTLQEFVGKRGQVGRTVFAAVQPSGSSSPTSYVLLYTGDQFTPQGTPIPAEYPVLSSPQAKAYVSAVGFNQAGVQQVFGLGNDGYYYLYNYLTGFTEKSTQKLFKVFSGANSCAKLFAVSPMELDPTQSWIARPGSYAAQGGSSCPTKSSALTSMTFSTASPTYSTSTTNPLTMRVYSYLGSGDSTTSIQNPEFQSSKITQMPKYAAHPYLFMAGTGTGSSWAPQNLFMVPVTSSTSSSRTRSFPQGAYLPFAVSRGSSTQTDQTGSSQSGSTDDTSSSASTGNTITFTSARLAGQPVTVVTNLVDSRTKASYITVKDANGIHFYAVQYTTVPGSILQQIQKKVGAYVSLTLYGDVMLFVPIETSGLTQIQTMIKVPQGSASAAEKIIDAGQFFSDTAGRYLYKYNRDSDKTKPYYRAAAQYVDLRLGVLYNTSGIPVGAALSYPELALLLSDNNIGAIPSVPPQDAQPVSYTIQPGYSAIQDGTVITPTKEDNTIKNNTITLSPTEPYLVYAG